MQTSSRGRRWLSYSEARELKAYKDSRGIWTIGIGHIGLVRGKPIDALTIITDAECDALYAADLVTAETAVNLSLGARVIPQAAFDALVSFVLNIGVSHWKIANARMLLEHGDPMTSVAGALFGFTKAGNDPYILGPRRAREAYLMVRGTYIDHEWKREIT